MLHRPTAVGGGLSSRSGSGRVSARVSTTPHIPGAVETEQALKDSSRTQGGLICVAVVVVAAIFLLGLLQQSYWALALPVAIVVAFVLGLTFWVGYTIATIQVEPYEEADPGDSQPPGDEHPA